MRQHDRIPGVMSFCVGQLILRVVSGLLMCALRPPTLLHSYPSPSAFQPSLGSRSESDTGGMRGEGDGAMVARSCCLVMAVAVIAVSVLPMLPRMVESLRVRVHGCNGKGRLGKQ